MTLVPSGAIRCFRSFTHVQGLDKGGLWTEERGRRREGRRGTLGPMEPWTLWAWGEALRAARTDRGLSVEDVAQLANLGERLGAADVAAVEAGRSCEVVHYVEVGAALGLGIEVALVPVEDLDRRWVDGYLERERARRATLR